MEIVPNSLIYILHNVPLDITYEHTLYFDTAGNQYNYFYSKRKWTIDNSTYQRVNKGKLRIGKPADDLYDCNYLMFNNGVGSGQNYFKNKWFYAFIKSVEYVNNVTCEITYEIDVMQTWFFDYEVEDSFIEREHSLTDNIGDNLVPENLDTGDFMYGNEIRLTPTNMSEGWDIIIAATWRYDKIEDKIVDYDGGMFGGVFCGLYLNHFTNIEGASAADQAVTILEKATKDQKSNGITGVYMCPHWIFEKFGAVNYYVAQVPKAVNYNAIWGFNPKNNKLKTSPYLSMIVTNNNGDTNEYPYEYFSTQVSQLNPSANPEFKIYGTFTPDGALRCVPLQYKDIPENYPESLSINALPQCAYNIDTYKAWWAQNGLSVTTGLLWDGVGLLRSGVSASVDDFASTAQKITQTLATIEQKSRMPHTAHGQNTSTLLALMGKISFSAYAQYIRPEFAHIIDEYFNVYGYATHRVKKPNIGTRPFWNYVKTLRVNLTGSVPCDVLQKIASIYDTGVTFWKVTNGGVSVGDYSKNNSPV